MTNKKFLAVLAAMGLAFLAMISGGCGGSSSGGGVATSYRDQFVDAVGDVVDNLQAIAGSAMSNRKIITAVNDIAMQYLVSSGDTTVRDRAIGRTFMAGDVTSRDITGNPYFDKAAFVKLWSNKHITVRNGKVETFEIGQSDFQLTITGSDGHVTKLTVTPTSNTGYWQAFAGLSAVFDALFGQEMANQFGETHSYLIFTYVYSSANVKLEYDGTTLLDGTISLNFSGKAADSMVYMNTPHTAAYAFTLYPQDNKDYTVGFDLTRETKSNGSNSVSRTVASKLYRKGSTNMTLFDVNAGMNATVTDGSTRPSAANLTAFDMNIADRIRIAESSTLDLVSLMRLYATGNSASEETVRSNAASMNTLLSNAGLSVYLNNSTGKAGDIRALAGKFGAYNHVRLGVQFVGESEPELVRDIANPDDLKQLRTLIGNVAPQVQALAQLLMSTGLMGDVTGNDIVQLIFEDLFGTN